MRQVFLPEHLDDLWNIIENEQEARLYAGGTDLLVRLRFNLAGSPVRRFAGSFVCLERIHELKSIHEKNGHIFIGSCVTHANIAENQLIQKHFPVLIKALEVLGSPPIRNMGTIGGNICTASPAGDTLPPLYVLGAFLELRSAVSSRFLPLKSFIKGPGSTAIQKGEIVYGIWVNKEQDYNVCHYEKVGQRNALAISIASLAALLKTSPSGTIERASLAWGSVGPTIFSSQEIEKALVGKPLTAESLMPVVSLVGKAVSPIDDVRASADYRRKVAGNLLFRLLEYGNHAST
jgi:xanthine dehydrogenase FAD-binding subunit